MAALCSLLKERRLEIGASVYGVAQASGVTQQAIGNYEKKLRQPTLDCLVKVCGALGITPVQLFQMAETRIGPPPPRQIASPARKKKAESEGRKAGKDSVKKTS